MQGCVAELGWRQDCPVVGSLLPGRHCRDFAGAVSSNFGQLGRAATTSHGSRDGVAPAIHLPLLRSALPGRGLLEGPLRFLGCHRPSAQVLVLPCRSLCAQRQNRIGSCPGESPVQALLPGFEGLLGLFVHCLAGEGLLLRFSSASCSFTSLMACATGRR